MEAAIRSLITSQTKLPLRPFTLEKIMGEASYREYFRLRFDNGESLIVMKMPTGYSSISEEVTKTSRKIEELPFLNVWRYLKSVLIPVPDVLAYSAEDGLLLLEDLGDASLEKTVQNLPSTERIRWYERAIDLLVFFQKKTRNNLPEDCIAAFRKFDADLLDWEFDHFLEYGIEDRFQVKVETTDRKNFTELTRAITQKIIQMPQGLVHRDFQSRNLMVKDHRLTLIDFQDALIGPILYDLVALLRDSYIELSPDELKTLQTDYSKKIDANHPYFGQLKKIQDDFDLITIQRKLKDTGRFQYIKTIKKNGSFLKSVPASLQYAKQALERQTQYSELVSVIAKYVPEFR